jgi:hypothetical protein
MAEKKTDTEDFQKSVPPVPHHEQFDPEKVDEAIAKLKELRRGTRLGGLSWKMLRDEGRK